jgi:hypothetical protein
MGVALWAMLSGRGVRTVPAFQAGSCCDGPAEKSCMKRISASVPRMEPRDESVTDRATVRATKWDRPE